VTAEAFASGRLSYSKVRAVTRFASAEDEARIVGVAGCATAARMEQLQAGMRRARTGDDVRKRHAARGVRWRFDDDGSLVGAFRLPPEQGATVVKALEVARGRFGPVGEDDASAEAPASTMTVVQSTADALVAMAEALLATASAEASPAAVDRFQLVIHSSLDALAQPDDAADDSATGSELANGVRLPPSTARRLTCACPASSMISGPDGQILHAGRRTRRIRGRLLRAVNARDRGCCRAPGCTEQRPRSIMFGTGPTAGPPTCPT